MGRSVDGYTPVPPDILQRLIDHWLPELRSVQDRRRGTRRLMVLLFLIPPALMLAVFAYAVVNGEVNVFRSSSALAMLSGWVAVAFVYFGKLQACDDVIQQISLAVYLGFTEPILEAIPNLSCYSKFRGVIADVRHIFH